MGKKSDGDPRDWGDSMPMLRPEKDGLEKAGGSKGSIPLTGVVCANCGKRNGEHRPGCSGGN